MAGLQKINSQAIKFVERKSKKEFFRKPTVHYGSGECRNTYAAKHGHVTQAKVVIDKNFSKEPYRLMIPPILVHELRENLGFQHGEGIQEAHMNARRLEQKVLRNMGKAKTDAFYSLAYLLGYSTNTREKYKR